MTQSSWPFDGIDTTETEYSQLFRRLKVTGVWGDPTTTDLKITGDSSGLQVKLAAGFAFVRGHMYYSSAVVTVPIGAGSAGARVDLVVLRLDPSANTITPTVIAGTSGSAIPNAVTQTDAGVYDLIVGQVAVPASASTITAENVTDSRAYTDLDYGIWTTANRPVSPRLGKPGFNTTVGKPEFWDGTAWVGFTPTSIDPNTLSSAVPITKGGTGQITADAARTAMGIRVTSTVMTSGTPVGTLRFW